MQPPINARLATLDVLLETTIPAFLSPPPSRATLREWFERARIPRFKANPLARRGGGPVYYSVAAWKSSSDPASSMAPSDPMGILPGCDQRPDA